MNAFEEARRRLVGAASMYGAGKNMAAKCPELAATPIFLTVLNDCEANLKKAAEDYFDSLMQNPPPTTA